MGELDEFRTEAARALELNASDGTTLGLIGMYTAWSGDWEQGLEMMDKARQLNPNYPGYYDVVAGTAEFVEEVVRGIDFSVPDKPGDPVS